jgi:hypothetical protein
VSRPVAALLGIANVVPWIDVWSCCVAPIYGYAVATKDDSLGWLLLIRFGPGLVIVALAITYTVVAVRLKHISELKRVFWVIGIWVAALVVFPVFWYLYVWRAPPKRVEASAL